MQYTIKHYGKWSQFAADYFDNLIEGYKLPLSFEITPKHCSEAVSTLLLRAASARPAAPLRTAQPGLPRLAALYATEVAVLPACHRQTRLQRAQSFSSLLNLKNTFFFKFHVLCYCI